MPSTNLTAFAGISMEGDDELFADMDVKVEPLEMNE
jgi:hypothetical protein